jgi:hypothetical protein
MVKGDMGLSRIFYSRLKGMFAQHDRDVYWFSASGLIFLKLILHFVANNHYELHRDEMLYFNMADHMSWGYATVPPMTACFALLAKTIFGYSVFGIRFFPTVIGAAMMFMMARYIRLSGAGVMAMITALSCFLLSPGFLLFQSMLTPNVFEQFLWCVICMEFDQFMNRSERSTGVIIGVCLGLAMLTKYSVSILVVGLMVGITLTGRWKSVRPRTFWICALVAFLIFLPNLVWQYQRSWPVLHHMDELGKTQLSNFDIVIFARELFALTGWSTIVWVLGLAAISFSSNRRPQKFLGYALIFTILFIVLAHGKAYYLLSMIPILFCFGGMESERLVSTRSRVYWAVPLAVMLSYGILTLPYGLPVLSMERLSKYSGSVGRYLLYPFAYWEDGRRHPLTQVYADMTGWKELAELVNNAYHTLTPNEQERCTIYVERNYGDAGAIHFYGKAYGLPDAVTFLESYTIWAPDFIPSGPIIYINQQSGDMKQLYHDVAEFGRVKNEYFRENGLAVFVCKNPAMDIVKIYHEKASREKRLFGVRNRN